MLHHYSTADVPDAKSVDAWRQAMAEVYYRLDIKCSNNGRLNGEITDAHFETMGISTFKADAQRVIRHRDAAKIDRSEDLVFLFPTRKVMCFEQRGRSGVITPGDVFLLNSAEDYIVDVPDGSANITIKIDRDLLVDRVGGIDEMCAKTHIANPYLIPAVTTLAEQLSKFQTSQNVDRIQKSVIDLICLMLETRQRNDLDSPVRQTLAMLLFDRCLVFLRDNLHRRDLSPDIAAQHLRISVRYLHKIFQHNQLSFGQKLLEMRLQKAQNLVVMKCDRGRINLGEVAFNCGFSSQSYFSACYRRHFGMSPSDAGR
ncbi:AraC family transcriptional regulator [Tardiphaga robiniae]|uniref:AraC family transcriptional regulator n=1 Tax=Tardiphaga robiniae TaxID=943830 RepID=UPI0015865C76|nr:AraC family transcriptional regulator [Tardiphaga robiniae]NUU42624.1 AraC family transcriptional regulator [Tardiphaga robiniae]